MEDIPILNEIYDALDKGLSHELTESLDEFPIEYLDKSADKGYFVCFMDRAKRSPLGKKAARIIMHRWMKGDIDEHLPASPVYFLMQPDIDQSIIDLMLQSLDELSYAEYVYDLIRQDSSPKVEMALVRLDRSFGDQDQEVYNALLDVIKAQQKEEGDYNHVAKEFLEGKLDIVSEYAPRPDWIKSYYDSIPDEEDPELDLVDMPSLKDILPSPSEAASLILERFETLPLVGEALKPVQTLSDVDDETPSKETIVSCPMLTQAQKIALGKEKDSLHRSFLNAYNVATVEGKMSLLGNDITDDIVKEALINDKKLFTILGPSNPIYGMEYDPDSMCCKYGGCRMLTCIDFENDDEFGEIDPENPEETIEWFTGSCESCHRKIAKKIYALRRPLTFGGWKGTFCSFKCLRDIVRVNDVMDHFIINQIETQLMEIGIQDRIVSGEGELNNEELERELEFATQRNLEEDYTHVTIETIPKIPTRV